MPRAYDLESPRIGQFLTAGTITGSQSHAHMRRDGARVATTSTASPQLHSAQDQPARGSLWRSRMHLIEAWCESSQVQPVHRFTVSKL
eukprot:scaffold156804_cov31-Prasinocladus_malaysianus.AAC.2